jgi:transcriptional regulator with XRE-family HTH domain
MVAGIDMDATAKRLDELRKERNLSIKDIQNHFNFYTPQAVYKWMNGQALPTIDNLVILADLYKVSVDEMLVRIEF